MRAYERLLEYVKVKTPSSEENMETPSSSCQFELAERLVGEMKELGIEDAAVDGKCYVYGTIPATEGYENSPSLGFIAHMDTVSEFTENPIHPVLHENYDGQNLVFDEGGRVLDTVLFPHLKNLKGRTLITSDGTTILGADDKAGIAEIMTMAENILCSNVPHGKICLAFTPDEEIGRGADHFDVEGFAADFAYTVDGGAEGEIEYENFNACEAVFKIQGVNVHPGSAKGIMINAGAVGCEIQMMLPQEETPEQTEGYEGFYHLVSMSGEVAEAELHYIVRDHDKDLFEAKKKTLKLIEKDMNEKWGEGTVKLTITQQYKNMSTIIKDCMHLIENAKTACENANVPAQILPIRGGTDGARLSFMGLPCPNLCTGGENYHGRYEYACVQSMEKTTELLIAIAAKYADR